MGDGPELFMKVAEKVNQWGAGLLGRRGYSSVGAVVGARPALGLHHLLGRQELDE